MPFTLSKFRCFDVSKFLLLLGALLAGGCATSQHSTAGTKIITSPAGTVVEVNLDEYHIHMPTTIPSGSVSFQIRNTGNHEHNIRIVGHGVDATLPHNLKPGEHAELPLTLEPGTYKVTCPVGPHAMLGMRLDLTVSRPK